MYKVIKTYGHDRDTPVPLDSGQLNLTANTCMDILLASR